MSFRIVGHDGLQMIDRRLFIKLTTGLPEIYGMSNVEPRECVRNHIHYFNDIADGKYVYRYNLRDYVIKKISSDIITYYVSHPREHTTKLCFRKRSDGYVIDEMEV